MNIIDILKMDKGYQLGEKIEAYARDFIIFEGEELIDNGFSGSDGIQNIVDFKELNQGCETYIQGHAFPIRQCIQGDRSVNLQRIKRLIPIIFKTIKTPIDILYIYFNWNKYLDFLHFYMKDIFYHDVKYYSQPVSEIYKQIRHEKIRDVFCAILEGDVAYRYRVQDILPEVSKSKLIRTPIKELQRLVGLLFEREGNEGTHATLKFKSVMWLIWIYLKFNKKLLDEIKDSLLRMDMDNIRLNESDKYWIRQNNFSYNFNYE